MKEFQLQIVTPAGILFDGAAEQLSVRSIDGEVAVMAGHIPYVTALAKGNCRVYVQGKIRKATCGGGLLEVGKENVRLLSPDFHFTDT
ncbi:MAG: F0F1 ATP synthase subunit epsilon [Clostridia bacterium]|nr:F0F1 ATP synthase subunit epsilon [Clostridia bacterium]MBR6780514.1 F0F1 ATP synthase subunit epsilon [Clostridia bacterium]